MLAPVDALVVTCSDSRLHRADRPYLAEFLRGKHIGIQTWDLVALPGAASGLAANKATSERDALLRAVKLAHDAHGATRVFIVNHSDCDTYGSAGTFPDPTAEFRKHAEDLRGAREVLRESLPNLDLRLFFATVENRADGPFVTFDEVR